jgi:hypothetical protein
VAVAQMPLHVERDAHGVAEGARACLLVRQGPALNGDVT